MHSQFTPKDIDRFWSKVNKDGPIPEHRPELGPCWIWTGGFREEYGRFKAVGRDWVAHRAAWEIAFGTLFVGQCACHHCDNPSCVRPSHLFQGTMDENNKDRNAKGRQATGDRCGSRLHPESVARGERHGSHTKPQSFNHGPNHWLRRNPDAALRGSKNGHAKLTESQVSSIRTRYLAEKTSQVALAKEFGVGQATISRVVRGEGWQN